MRTLPSSSRKIHLSRPLDLRATLGPLRHGPLDPTISIGPTSVVRATRTPQGPATTAFRIVSGWCEIHAWGPGAEAAIETAPELLGEGDDPDDFRPVHPLLRSLHRQRPGLRMCRTKNIFEALIPTILEQKVTSKEAHRSWAAIVRAWGEPAPGPGGLRLPPSPRLLAATPYTEFHRFGVERRRARLISAVCTRATSIDRLASRDERDAEAGLLSLPGIGPWTAASVVQVTHGAPDAVIVGDYHLPQIVTWALIRDPSGTDERMLSLLEEFKGHRARAVRLIVTLGTRPPHRGPRRELRDIRGI